MFVRQFLKTSSQISIILFQLLYSVMTSFFFLISFSVEIFDFLRYHSNSVLVLIYFGIVLLSGCSFLFPMFMVLPVYFVQIPFQVDDGVWCFLVHFL